MIFLVLLPGGLVLVALTWNHAGMTSVVQSMAPSWHRPWGTWCRRLPAQKLDIISCRDGEAENGYHRCANAVTFEATRRISGDLIHEVDGRVQ